MIIYNTTFLVSFDMQQQFICFLREDYIPLAIKSGKVYNARLSKIAVRDNSNDGDSFALEFSSSNQENLDVWINEVGNNLLRLIQTKFGNNVLFFGTQMEQIEI